MTVAEYAQEWLRSLDKRPATLAMYGSIVRNQLGDVGTLRLVRVGVPDIRALLAERSREGYAGRTRRAILDVLRMIFRMAEADGLRSDNPAALVDAPRIDAKEPVHWNVAQAKAFLAAVDDESLRSLYTVALYTGARRGELLGLTWRGVDLDDRMLFIAKSKTAAGIRRIPLVLDAYDALASMKRAPGPLWHWSPAYATRRVGHYAALVGLPPSSFHTFRHSTASILLELGVPIDLIREILGQTNVRITAHYARSSDDRKREALERLGRAVG